MKRMALSVTLLIVAMVLVTGCVSKSSYDAAVKESNELKGQLSKAQADLAAVQQSLTVVTADRDATKSQLDKTKADLDTAQKALSTVSASVKGTQPYVDVASAYLSVAAAGLAGGPQTDVLAAVASLSASLSATQDASLKAAWDTFVARAGIDQENAANVAFIKLLIQRLGETKPKIS
ncbi:MAG: hypothetical protein HYX87_07170 [Chloroflexi bacterium]|nr:hypothetical protein [Chloroflexota bacterium]